jgi:hypothetical protein
MTNEVDISIPTQDIIDALEDTGDYKVFEDNKDGIEEATEWMQEHDCVIYSDDSEAIEKIVENNSVGFILDHIKPADLLDYAFNTYINKTVDRIVDNHQNVFSIRADDIAQALIMHKGVDYVLDQVGLDNRVTRACTTDYHYVFDALKERRGVYLAEDELSATRHLMGRLISKKGNMEMLGQYLEANCPEEGIDAMLGPIYSDKIIRHVESSIDGLVIRKKEEPTDELCEIFLSYLDEFAWREQFIKLMRRHGVMLETIIRAYVDDERAEEREHNGN